MGELQTMVAKFATDIPMLRAWGEPFLLGPASIRRATPEAGSARKNCWLRLIFIDLATAL